VPKFWVWCAPLVFFAILLVPEIALGDADENPTGPAGPNLNAGLQPLVGAVPTSTPYPGESRLRPREDGTYEAIPTVFGRRKTFHLVERRAPWSLKKGLRVMANTYNGVVPGPVLVVNQGDEVVIDYTNELAVPDMIHLHGIHGIPDTLDGVAGISQPMVPKGGLFRYAFLASQPGTFIYHTHDSEAMLDSGLYGAIVVLPKHPRPEERVDRDDVEIVSSWQIQSNAENHFTINGREYPATWPIEVREGQLVRIRWINISGEEWHTMHTHGHDQLLIARDAQPVSTKDVQDTVAIGPGQRVDVVIKANQRPGNWLVHCHVLDHTEDAQGMPAGLVTTIHYAGVPNAHDLMGTEMQRAMAPAMQNIPGNSGNGHAPLSFFWTLILGAIAGLTIFFGLPVARMRRASPAVMASLNALAIGILVYLVVEIAGSATAQVMTAVHAWRLGGPLPPVLSLSALYVVGLLIGLVGLGALANKVAHRHADAPERPLAIAGMIAMGIGAHNFAEGLAIGASAASGATAIALSLIVGFGLHNATEGFAVAAPMTGRLIPGWGQLIRLGLVAGGPTFIGSLIGYVYSAPELNVLFLAIAVGALVFVIGELWAVLKRLGLTIAATTMLAVGFIAAFATEVFLDLNGG
jgi:zinc transporter, ZIP family